MTKHRKQDGAIVIVLVCLMALVGIGPGSTAFELTISGGSVLSG